jgi:hypothetical protein
MEAYQASVKLNSMREDAWFSLGCAALNIKEWAVAVTAFRAKLDLEARGHTFRLARSRFNTDVGPALPVPPMPRLSRTFLLQVCWRSRG